MGGACLHCGYDRYIGALELHHLDSDEKEFTISSMRVSNWNLIKEEIKKCMLLCAICHREVHAGIIDISDLNQEFSFDDYDPIKSQNVLDWNSIDLESEMMRHKSYSKISKELGVSVETVKKRCLEQGVASKRIGRGKSIDLSKFKLEELIKKYSQKQIADMYGVTPTTIHRYMKKFNIDQ